MFIRVDHAQSLWEIPWQPQAVPALVQELWLASWPGSGPQKHGMQRTSQPSLAGRRGRSPASSQICCVPQGASPAKQKTKGMRQGYSKTPKDDMKLYKSKVSASADSTWLMFFTSDLEEKMTLAGTRRLVLSSNYFSSKRHVSGSFSQQNAVLLSISLCSSLLLFVREWAGECGWLVCRLSTSLQIICRLQVKCRHKVSYSRSCFSYLDKQGLMWDFMRFLYCYCSTWFPLRKHWKPKVKSPWWGLEMSVSGWGHFHPSRLCACPKTR